MTPEQERQFNTLVREFESMKTQISLDAYENFIDELVKRKTNQDEQTTRTSDITKTTSVPEGGGSVSSFDFPDEWMILKYKGELVRVPVYKESRFT
jgi:hypothetical protein